MSRTGRTYRAQRAAAVVRPPSLLLLPLLLGAALAALWLIGAPPAQADTAGPPGLSGKTPPDRTASLSTRLSQGLEPLLETGLPEITAPVTGTLGGIHRNLEERTEPSPTVTEVGEGVRESARRVIRGLAATDQIQAENLVAHIAATRAAPVPTDTAPGITAAEAGGAEDARSTAESGESAQETAEAEEDTRRETATAPIPPRAVEGVADDAPEDDRRRATDTAEHDAPAPAHPELSTGSPSPSGAGSPSIAGYLTVVPVAAPAADMPSAAVDAAHPVPSTAADDLTVSPD